jgi:hypothetical protein
MMMRKLKINRMDFETAFELSSYEMTAYLDTETGAVIFVRIMSPINWKSCLPMRTVKMSNQCCRHRLTYPTSTASSY